MRRFVSSVFCSFYLMLTSFSICSSCSLNFIKDFLLTQKSPVKVRAILCWNQVQLINLMKLLSYHDIQNSVLNTNKDEFVFNHTLRGNEMFVLDLSCNESMDILIKANEYQLFKHPFRWLVLKNDSVEMGSLENLQILIDSQFYVASYINRTYYLENPYKIHVNEKYLSSTIALWREPIGIQYFNQPKARDNLMGVTINVSLVITNLDTLNHLTDYRNDVTDSVSVINYLLLTHLLHSLNASGNFVIQRIWGYKNDSQKYYNGMLGDLQKGITELSSTPSFIIKERFSIIDYLPETTPDVVQFIFKAPALSYISNIFLLTFDRLVWISCFGMVTIFCVILYFISVWEWKSDQFNETQNKHVSWLRANFYESVMIQIGGISQQGTDAEPRSLAGRIALLFSFIFLMFIYTSFSATIVALLQSSSDSIRTLEDLLNSGFEFGVQDTSYSRYYFPLQEEPVRKAIYEQKIAPKGEKPHFMDTDQGIAKVRNEFFAFHAQENSAYKIISKTFTDHEKCGLHGIKYLQTVTAWNVMKKKSSFKEIIKIGYRKLHERGIRKRESDRLFSKKPTCHGTGNIFRSVGLVDTYFCRLIFGIGISFSVVILILEILLAHYSRSYN